MCIRDRLIIDPLVSLRKRARGNTPNRQSQSEASSQRRPSLKEIWKTAIKVKPEFVSIFLDYNPSTSSRVRLFIFHNKRFVCGALSLLFFRGRKSVFKFQQKLIISVGLQLLQFPVTLIMVLLLRNNRTNTIEVVTEVSLPGKKKSRKKSKKSERKRMGRRMIAGLIVGLLLEAGAVYLVVNSAAILGEELAGDWLALYYIGLGNQFLIEPTIELAAKIAAASMVHLFNLSLIHI
eukprot:TRINITY_DN14158_c0_g1_i2.p1 TRINITY_DN14158_c0_g1~~TRINITY_DN14158_c0_g1_i2.p1  ORF type:complete len:254 (-),score=51.94 TRINITY_DN14158_c0_g1_i2:61-765(-)